MRNSDYIKSTVSDYSLLFADDLAYICTFKDKEVAEALAQIYIYEVWVARNLYSARFTVQLQ